MMFGLSLNDSDFNFSNKECVYFLKLTKNSEEEKF